MLIELTAPTFHGPVVLCKFVKFLQVIPLYSSSFLLVAISIDRYYAICRPLAHMRASQNRPRIYAVLAWLLAIVASIPQIFIFTKDTRGEVATELSYTHFQHQVYVVFFNVAVWLLPTIVAGILYCRVCHAVWCSMIYDDSYSFSWPNSRSVFSRRSLLSRSSTKFSFRSFRDRTSSNQSNHPVELQSLSNPATPTERIGYIGSNQKEEQEKKRIQTVKLTMTIVIAHFVLWAPFCIVNVIDAFAPQSINPILATHLMFLGNINSVMNPWIWFAFNYDSAKLAIRTSVREFRLERQRQSQRKRQSQDLSMDIATTASMMHSYENGL
uniref:G-protein coupled receptors family 1 profile domain-containing protein n=1 Tax=Acrobeloides nanus TaxID=290746 RepID=A0A914CAI9_9BILA